MPLKLFIRYQVAKHYTIIEQTEGNCPNQHTQSRFYRSYFYRNLSPEKNEKGSHPDSVPCIPIDKEFKEQQHRGFSPFKSSFDLGRQLIKKLKLSDFNDSHFYLFFNLFWTSKFEITSNRPI